MIRLARSTRASFTRRRMRSSLKMRTSDVLVTGTTDGATVTTMSMGSTLMKSIANHERRYRLARSLWLRISSPVTGAGTGMTNCTTMSMMKMRLMPWLMKKSALTPESVTMPTSKGVTKQVYSTASPVVMSQYCVFGLRGSRKPLREERMRCLRLSTSAWKRCRRCSVASREASSAAAEAPPSPPMASSRCTTSW